jgi:hypothetical protein
MRSGSIGPKAKRARTKAINLYNSAGFETEHELVVYQVQL